MFEVINFFLIQIFCQPFVSVEVDLDHKRKPGLKPYMHKPKLPIQEIKIQCQAAESTTDQPGSVFPVRHGNAGLLFNNGKNTYETALNAVLFGYLMGESPSFLV